MATLRRQSKTGRLEPERLERLKDVGFVWDARESKWMRLLERAETALADAQRAAGRQHRQPPDSGTPVSFSCGTDAETGIVRELL